MNKKDTLESLTAQFQVAVVKNKGKGTEHALYTSPGVVLAPLMFVSAMVLSKLKLDAQEEGLDSLDGLSCISGILEPVSAALKDLTHDPDFLVPFMERTLQAPDMRKPFYTFLEAIVDFESAIQDEAVSCFEEELDRVLHKDIDKSTRH